MPGGRALWSYISKHNPQILSAYVEETYDPNCIPGKTAWLRKNTRLTDKSRINLVRRKEKKNFATRGGQKNILIDDYIKNVREFTSAGGIGIHHTSTSKTLSALVLPLPDSTEPASLTQPLAEAKTSFFSAVVKFLGFDSSASVAPHKLIVFLLINKLT